MSTIAARTKGSSQVPVSRAAPRGSVASRTQTSAPRSDEQENQAASVAGSASRYSRPSIAPSQVNDSRSDIDARRKSTVAFRSAPSVAPTDSISHVGPRSGGQTRQYSVVNTAVPSTQYSPADVGYRGDRRSRVSAASSLDGTAKSGSAVPLTATNLETHNTAPKSTRAPSSINEPPVPTVAPSRRDSRRYTASPEPYDDRPRATQVDEGRRRSSRQSSHGYGAAPDDYESQASAPRVDRDYRRSSRRYSRAVDDDASYEVSEPPPPRRRSRRYSNTAYEPARAPVERGPPSSVTSRRHSVATADHRSVYDSRTRGPSQAVVPYVAKADSSVTPTQVRDDWSNARAGEQTPRPPKTRRTFSEWQSLEIQSQSRPATNYRGATRGGDSIVSSPQLSPKSAPRTMAAAAAGGVVAGAAEAAAARSSTRATSISNDQSSFQQEMAENARSRRQSTYSRRERRRESQADEVADAQSRRDSVHSKREFIGESRPEEQEETKSRARSVSSQQEQTKSKARSVHSQREATSKAKTAVVGAPDHRSTSSSSRGLERPKYTVVGPQTAPPSDPIDPNGPNLPQPPTWQRKTRVITRQMPDGSIVKDTIHRFETGRYVTAY